MKLIHWEFMHEAMSEAVKSQAEGGIPIGAVMVKNDVIIGRGHNRRFQKGNPMLHAEIECITQAFHNYDYLDISSSTIYVTLMPCFMCAGAIIQYGISQVISAENETFPHAQGLLQSHGIVVINLNLLECKQVLRNYIRAHKEYWLATSANNTHILGGYNGPVHMG